jgi:hypothetical protein
MGKLLAYCLIGMLAACAPAPPAPVAFHPRTLVDGGGDLNARIARVRRDALLHEEVRILGWCMSACALDLSAGPNVCVAPRARIGVHEVRIPPHGFKPDSEGYARGARSESLTAEFISMLPTCARNLFLARGGFASYQLVSATGAEILAACPQIRACS